MLEICPMEEKDLDEVAAIESSLFTMPWSKKNFLDSLLQEDTRYLTVKEDEKVVGYCGFLRSFEEADITNVAVTPSAQGRGIACAMLRKLICLGEAEGIQSFTLEVRRGNHRAIHLYEKLGFVSEGIRPKFYEKPKEDAVIMWKRG